MPLVAPPAGAAHALGLTIGRQSARVQVSGEIDLAAVADLTRLMDSLDLLAYMSVDVDLSDVTFLDSSGVSPLVEAARRRQHAQLPPILIGLCSPAARFLLDVAELGGSPYLDVAAWDRVQRPKRHWQGAP